jgi:hypothetical protein
VHPDGRRRHTAGILSDGPARTWWLRSGSRERPWPTPRPWDESLRRQTRPSACGGVHPRRTSPLRTRSNPVPNRVAGRTSRSEDRWWLALLGGARWRLSTRRLRFGGRRPGVHRRSRLAQVFTRLRAEWRRGRLIAYEGGNGRDSSFDKKPRTRGASRKLVHPSVRPDSSRQGRTKQRRKPGVVTMDCQSGQDREVG